MKDWDMDKLRKAQNYSKGLYYLGLEDDFPGFSKQVKATLDKVEDELRDRIIKEKGGRLYITDAEEINKQVGQHWFDTDTKRFFSSRIETKALAAGQLIGNKYFVSSEQNKMIEGEARLYSVRKFDPVTGSVGTVGEFQEWPTLHMAKNFAQCLADNNEDVELCRKEVSR